ncbi:hypothetical protein RJ55_07466 [Drechmeria coniospora]|nr:hypothetical protein RJ55_07466 [Drechmeria coniospora]
MVKFTTGNTTVLHGTAQQVRAEALLDWHAPSASMSTIDRSAGPFDTIKGHIELHCNTFPLADHRAIYEARMDLNSWQWDHVQPTLPAGPRKCGQVSCSSGAAIWWCNDEPTTKTLGSYRDIVNGADFITAVCGEAMYSGQIFHPQNWNVIVQSGDC